MSLRMNCRRLNAMGWDCQARHSRSVALMHGHFFRCRCLTTQHEADVLTSFLQGHAYVTNHARHEITCARGSQ